MSTANPSLIAPKFPPQAAGPEAPETRALISSLNLQKHIEGGYFVETDRDAFLIPNPFLHSPVSSLATSTSATQLPTRNASTTIYYFLSPKSSIGAFHRNKGRTIHTLHWGRGRYVIIHVDEVEGSGEKARVETFVVGRDVAKGEKLQWIVEGGKYKASFLLPDDEMARNGSESHGLLISETVIPGFEYADHDFMTCETLERLVTDEQVEEMAWLLRKGEQPNAEELL